jgi:hypothetical protein
VINSRNVVFRKIHWLLPKIDREMVSLPSIYSFLTLLLAPEHAAKEYLQVGAIVFEGCAFIL